MRCSRVYVQAAIVVCLALVAIPAPVSHAVDSHRPRATRIVCPPQGPPSPEPRPRPPCVPAEQPASVCASLALIQEERWAPGALTSAILTVRNEGRGAARPVQVTLPAPRAAVAHVVAAAFSDARAWVREVRSDTILLEIERLDPGQVVTATVQMRLHPALPADAALDLRATYRWHDGRRAGEGLTNRAVLADGLATGPGALPAPATLAHTPAGLVSLAYDGFASGERVGLWYHHPGAGDTPLTAGEADDGGRVTFVIAPQLLPQPGGRLVAGGQCSGMTAASLVP